MWCPPAACDSSYGIRPARAERSEGTTVAAAADAGIPAIGDSVVAGEVVGAVSTVLGEEIERIVAPDSGVVLFTTSVPPVAEQGILMGVGVEGSLLV